MKKLLAMLLATSVFLLPTIGMAESIDISGLTKDELLQLISDAHERLNTLGNEELGDNELLVIDNATITNIDVKDRTSYSFTYNITNVSNKVLVGCKIRYMYYTLLGLNSSKGSDQFFELQPSETIAIESSFYFDKPGVVKQVQIDISMIADEDGNVYETTIGPYTIQVDE